MENEYGSEKSILFGIIRFYLFVGFWLTTSLKTNPTTSEQSIEQQKQEQQQLSGQDDSGEQMIAPRETWVQWKGLGMLEVPEKLMDRPEQLLRRVAYMVSYNSGLRIPYWVAWKLAAERIEGITCIKY